MYAYREVCAVQGRGNANAAAEPMDPNATINPNGFGIYVGEKVEVQSGSKRTGEVAWPHASCRMQVTVCLCGDMLWHAYQPGHFIASLVPGKPRLTSVIFFPCR